MENLGDNLSRDFEELIKKILLENKFEITDAIKERYDFEGSIDGVKVQIELKFYKRKYPKLDLLRQAYRKLRSQKETNEAKQLLIVSSYIIPSLRHEIYEESGVVVWDAYTLLAISFEFPTLYYELQDILTVTFGEEVTDHISLKRFYPQDIIENLKQSSTKRFVKQSEISKGEELCKELNFFEAGRLDAANFERKCTEILKYLFDNKTDLTLWEEQNTTEDSLHRFDLLCRIIASYPNTFWTTLSTDFNTRYVVFEFKNYSGRITQSEIYTTEKYLFLTALRSVSFIIARNGAKDNAKKAAKGALKEAGKLIVILTKEDLCEMLKLRDKGEEPADVLQMKIDEILSTLTR